MEKKAMKTKKEGPMPKIIGWLVAVVMLVLLVKFIFGLVASLVPLVAGIIIGVPVGWIMHAVNSIEDN